MEKVLNQEEIDAMVRVARGGATPPPQPGGPQVAAWDVRQAGQIGREHLRSINQLHEGFARNLTNSLGAYLRIVFEAGLVSAEHLSYREVLQRLPEVSYLASALLKPLGALAILQLDLSVAFPILDLLLGGEGRGAALTRDITEIEEQVLESVVRIICRELQAAWQALSLEFVFDQRQQPSHVYRLMPPDEKMLFLSFEITMPETRGTFNVCVPAVVSNALLRKISASFAFARPRVPASEDMLRRRLLHCPFELELVLPQIRVPVADLVGLNPGQLLRFDRRQESAAMLCAGGETIAQAIVARRGDHRAAHLRQIRTAVDERKEILR